MELDIERNNEWKDILEKGRMNENARKRMKMSKSKRKHLFKEISKVFKQKW